MILPGLFHLYLNRLTAFVMRVFSKGSSCGGVIDPDLLQHGVEYLCTNIQVLEGADLGRFVEKHWWYLDYRQTWIKVFKFSHFLKNSKKMHASKNYVHSHCCFMTFYETTRVASHKALSVL